MAKTEEEKQKISREVEKMTELFKGGFVLEEPRFNATCGLACEPGCFAACEPGSLWGKVEEAVEAEEKEKEETGKK